MTPAAILAYGTLTLWVVGGSLWLLMRRLYRLLEAPRFLIDLLGFPVELAQAIWGRAGVPYAFLLPNLVIFGLFTFVPLILNFHVAFTGGASISLFERPWVGWSNFAQLFACESILQPATCSNAGRNFWTSMYNTMWFVAIQVPVMCVVALATALVLNRSIAGRGFWRAMFFYPVMLSPVVIANIWKWVLNRRGALNEMMGAGAEHVSAMAGRAGFNMGAAVVAGILMLLSLERCLRAGPRGAPSLPWASLLAGGFVLLAWWANPFAVLGVEAGVWPGFGVAGAALWLVASEHRLARAACLALGAGAAGLLLLVQFDAVFDFGAYRPINWLVTPGTGWPFFWLVFVYCWSHVGFYMLILLAGLQAIPPDLYEAARMDGTKPVRIFFRITLPLLMPIFTVVLVLVLIRSFQVFDEVWLLTGGGPGRETFMLVQGIYEGAFAGNRPDYGGAAAGSIIMAGVIATVTALQLWLARRQSGV